MTFSEDNKLHWPYLPWTMNPGRSFSFSLSYTRFLLWWIARAICIGVMISGSSRNSDASALLFSSVVVFLSVYVLPSHARQQHNITKKIKVQREWHFFCLFSRIKLKVIPHNSRACIGERFLCLFWLKNRRKTGGFWVSFLERNLISTS